MIRRYKQSGVNNKYPTLIEAWEYGSGTIPDWISDKSKVTFIDGLGNVTLETHDTNTGGVEIIDSSGTSALVRLESKTDLICRDPEDDIHIFVLSRVQLNLLYKIIEEENERIKRYRKLPLKGWFSGN